jgi:hypothetical protein
MKRFLAIGALVIAACATKPQPAPTPPQPTAASQFADRAGDSVETAVEVPADAPNDGIGFENDWIYDRFGRFRRRGGGTGVLNNRRYDVIDVELPNGDKKKVYFDITENWTKWKPPQ